MAYLTFATYVPNWLIIIAGAIFAGLILIIFGQARKNKIKVAGMVRNSRDSINEYQGELEGRDKQIMELTIKLGRADQQQKFLELMINNFINKFAESRTEFEALPDGDYCFLGIYQKSSYLASASNSGTSHYILDLPNGWNMTDYVANGEIITKNSRGLFKKPQPFYAYGN